MNIRNIAISNYTYTLPEEKIAHHPLEERDASKLLVFQNGTISSSTYRQLDTYLPAGSLLVFNNTRVIAARLLFTKTSGGNIEIFCLEPGPGYADVASGMQEKGSVEWKCLIGGASKWKPGLVLEKTIATAANSIQLQASYVSKQSDCFIIKLEWQPSHLSFAEVLESAGLIPLPPYIKRAATEEDKDRYQTVYARQDGSVAAPTAGLHFTPQVFENLSAKNIRIGFVTLHVGAGTFKPVKAATMEGHDMHAEFIQVQKSLIEMLLTSGDRVYAVGTTSARTLESLYWMGVKTILQPGLTAQDLPVQQWEVYDRLQQHAYTRQEALQSLLQWMQDNQQDTILTKTQLLIAPGYRFQIIRGLITNFHQPQSTLLLLVAALTGNRWKEIYQYALDNDFRFLSYGDGCLLEGN
ncbi:MAG TPA: S-adenosylmethionine:tRNA ribosyltransferase-isomerase [Chitinophagaceae bacterium]|nr:S-adenosylmethionine:tRNA ribosyltransferase-isomerase [Chitinophagaceae bacterium]